MANEDWAKALAEVEDPKQRDIGLWARCFAESGGDESKAKAEYVKQRVSDGKPRVVMGYCPSCTTEVEMDAAHCKCGADFIGGGWKPSINRPKNAAFGVTTNKVNNLVKTAKSRGIYIILGLFFGCFGIHNFYAGRYGIGLAQFLITAVLGWFVVGFVITALWAIIEMFTVKVDGAGDPMS